MPELPEVESARLVLDGALRREIVEVDDHDEFVCRPHAPGEIAQVLTGGRLVATHRRGKSMWCETVTSDGTPGPMLGIHLGMGGRIVVTDPHGPDESAGDPVPVSGNPVWNRFVVRFADGGELRLFDKRRLGRVRLEPDIGALGPDAAEISRAEFRARVGRGKAPIKARLLDQSTLAGVGNLLADETLWQARISPLRRTNTLDDEALDHLRRVLRAATRRAIARGGVHTGVVIEHRRPGGTCPRCGAPMTRATVGGRTTWWCPVEQT
ncbi:MAG: formamidopyrimidine-DNA glycosylase [Geodermatophilaceae bacterium]|nr:formamidopyrimidine-DNA glycosylase [Geodermatophilaceae bacterium]